MLKSHNTKKKSIYCITALLGTCFIALLVYLFTSAGKVPNNQFQDQSVISPTAIPNELSQAENTSEQAVVTPTSTNNNESVKCSKRCSSTLSLLDQDLNLDDETFYKLSAHSKEIAVYLRNNKSKRRHYLQVAMTTEDDDKRKFLADIFKLLPSEQKAELGETLITAEDWRARTDGIELIIDDGISDLTMANKLIGIISNEEKSYVKGNILTHLKNSKALKGDTEFLYQLDSVINNDEDASTRVAALKAKMQLSKQPFHILPDAIQALHTSEPELQIAGLVVLGQILENEDEHIKNGAYIDKNTIKKNIQNIQSLPTDGDDKKQLEYLIEKADSVYSRYFEN